METRTVNLTGHFAYIRCFLIRSSDEVKQHAGTSQGGSMSHLWCMTGPPQNASDGWDSVSRSPFLLAALNTSPNAPKSPWVSNSHFWGSPAHCLIRAKVVSSKHEAKMNDWHSTPAWLTFGNHSGRDDYWFHPSPWFRLHMICKWVCEVYMCVSIIRKLASILRLVLVMFHHVRYQPDWRMVGV